MTPRPRSASDPSSTSELATARAGVEASARSAAPEQSSSGRRGLVARRRVGAVSRPRRGDGSAPRDAFGSASSPTWSRHRPRLVDVETRLEPGAVLASSRCDRGSSACETARSEPFGRREPEHCARMVRCSPPGRSPEASAQSSRRGDQPVTMPARRPERTWSRRRDGHPGAPSAAPRVRSRAVRLTVFDHPQAQARYAAAGASPVAVTRCDASSSATDTGGAPRARTCRSRVSVRSSGYSPEKQASQWVSRVERIAS